MSVLSLEQPDSNAAADVYLIDEGAVDDLPRGIDERKHRLKQPCLSVRHGDAAAQTGDRRGEIQAACIGRGVGEEAQQQRRALDG